MPVDFEAYDPNQGRMDLAEGTNARRILSFLVGHPDVGFTPKEVHEATGVARGSVGPKILLVKRICLRQQWRRQQVKHGFPFQNFQGGYP